MKEVAEGVPTIDAIINMNKELKLDIPIMNTIYQIIHNEITKNEAADFLMNYEVKSEFK